MLNETLYWIKYDDVSSDDTGTFMNTVNTVYEYKPKQNINMPVFKL